MVKVLSLGRVELSGESASQLINKMKAINSKYGPFESCLLTAENIGQEILSSTLEFPLPTYFIAGRSAFLPDISAYLSDNNNQLLPNFFYLDTAGFYHTVDGLRIAFLGGADSTKATDSDQQEFNQFYPSNVKTLTDAADAKQVDILLTFEWPEGIADDKNFSTVGSQLVKSVSLALKPRYHFVSGNEFFYERAPYRIANGAPTRFISLAPVGNTTKERWFYAINVTPASKLDPSVLLTEPPNTTSNPWTNASAVKRPAEDIAGSNFFFSPDIKRPKNASDKTPPEGYLCRICSEAGHFIQDCPKKLAPSVPEGYICNICKEGGHLIRDCPQRGAARRTDQPRDGYVCKICNVPGHFINDCPQKQQRQPQSGFDNGCWFCLSNPNLESHLVVSIGAEMYLSLPKGELVPDHLLLLSVEHVPNSLAFKTETAKQEIQKFKDALRLYYDEKNMDMAVFETSLKSQHMSQQIIPIPRNKSGELKAFIEKSAKDVDAIFENSENVRLDPKRPFYRFELPSGENLVYCPEGKFSLQFGRHVMANFLGLSDRADWKLCVKCKDDESRDAERFKFTFKKFDFTLEDVD